MKTIFIVTEYSGEYESFESKAVLATFNQELADQFVKGKEQDLVTRNKNSEQLRQHMIEWEKDNPRLDPNRELFLDFGSENPKSLSDKQKIKFEEIKKQNKIIVEANACYSREWVKNYHTESTKFIETFSEKDQESIRTIKCDSYWNIDEVPFAE